jgi:hypothetical protein
MLALMLTAALVAPPPDTGVVQIDLRGVGSVVAEALLDGDSLVAVAADPLWTLTGLAPPTPDAWVTLTEARARMPGVEVEWSADHAVLVLFDEQRTLPASRALSDARRAQAMSSPPGGSTSVRGPFGSYAADSDGGQRLDLGYRAGRFALSGAWSAARGGSGALSVQPASRSWVTVWVDEDGLTSADASLSFGRTFARATWRPEDPHPELFVATSAGHWTVFADTRERAALTYRGPIQVTVARDGDRAVFHASWGRAHSPLTIPGTH